MFFSLNKSILKVMKTIENAGGEAYLVGGCVRDMLLSLSPCDFDITTSLPPEKILTLFEKTVATGIKHGTVTVVMDNMNIEVTTYRTDGNYCDSRHPEDVHFVKSLKEDLARRDFTVNAIAYNPKVGIVDEFGGLNDLKLKLLRTVGDPYKRFSEDALRILRLFRFSCQLGFTAHEATMEAALKSANDLKNISRERIASELFKALISPYPQRLSPLIMAGALSFCGIEKGSISDEITLLPLDRDIRFYKLLYDCASEHITVCKELKTDNKLLTFCSEVNQLIYSPPTNESECKLALKDFSSKAVTAALLLTNSDSSMVERILSSKQPYRIKDLAVTGDDLKTVGMDGKEVGQALEFLIRHVIEHPEDNVKKVLLSIISK